MISTQSMITMRSLVLALGALLLGACSQHDLAQDTIPDGSSSSVDSTVHSPAVVALDLDQLALDGQTVRALSYGLREQDGKVNPYLDKNQARAGVDLHLLLVSSDPTQPTVIAPIRLYPNTTDREKQPVSTKGLYLRTPDGGERLNLAGAPDFRKGTWRMALVQGGTLRDGKLYFDPNGLERVKYPTDYASDYGIEEVFGKKHNLLGLTRQADSRQELDIPYFSQWQELTLGQDIVYRSGEAHLQPRGRFLLKPQGTLLRLKLRNENFSDQIRLAGLRFLTNSLAFRGYYDFSADKLGKGKAQAPDVTQSWLPLNTQGKPYRVSDSVTYRHPFPHYADFWLPKAEVIARNKDAERYFLVWAMPIIEQGKSRQGILHILLYDELRKGAEYNRAHTSVSERNIVIPKALIRKPALTRSFGAGRFALSDMTHSGQFLRLEGWQTPVYNALDFIEKEDAGGRGTMYTSDFAGLSIPAGSYVPGRQDWARIIPTKYPDNQIRHYRYYFYSSYGKGTRPNQVGNPAGLASHGYNSNLYYIAYRPTTDIIGRTADKYDIYLDEKDLPQGVTFTPLNPELDASKVGKANNRVRLKLPEAMLVPIVQGGKRVGYYQEDADSHFSTYEYQHKISGFTMVGWGLGQTYLSAYYYAGAFANKDAGGTNRKTDRIDVYGRYFGPAFHALYPGGANPGWVTRWPWDITFYGMGYHNSYDNQQSEREDTKRSFYYSGYQVRQANGSYQRLTGNQEQASPGMGAFWGKDNEWFFVYSKDVQDNEAPMGYDKAQDSRDNRFTPGQVKAPVRLFRNTPLPR